MRRQQGAAVWIVVAIAVPLAMVAAIGWGRGGAALWVVVHGCARVWATAVSLPAGMGWVLAPEGRSVRALSGYPSGRRERKSSDTFYVLPRNVP